LTNSTAHANLKTAYAAQDFLLSDYSFRINPFFTWPVIRSDRFPKQPAIHNRGNPTLVIVNPQENEQIIGTTVNASFIIKSFIFTDYKIITPGLGLEGIGHLHVWLDQEVKTKDNAQEITKKTDFSLENVTPGEHNLVFELVDNNHQSLQSPVRETVRFFYTG